MKKIVIMLSLFVCLVVGAFAGDVYHFDEGKAPLEMDVYALNENVITFIPYSKETGLRYSKIEAVVMATCLCMKPGYTLVSTEDLPFSKCDRHVMAVLESDYYFATASFGGTRTLLLVYKTDSDNVTEITILFDK